MSVLGIVCHLILYFLVNQGLAINIFGRGGVTVSLHLRATYYERIKSKRRCKRLTMHIFLLILVGGGGGF